MTHGIKKYLLVLLLLLSACSTNVGEPNREVLASPVATSNYYVSSIGSDTNPCTITQPCKTITRTIDVAPVGSTVVVQAGTYSENVRVTKSITLLSNNARIDGTGLPVQDGGGLINIPANVSGATVRGFEIANGGTYGISVFSNSNFISNNEIHNIRGAGIWMRNGNGNTFENNELYFSVLENSVSFDGARYTCNPNNTTGWASAVNPWGTANTNIWRGNYIHDNCGEGLVLYSGDIADGNILKDNWSVEIYIDGHTDVSVKNNIITNSRPYIPRTNNSNAWKSIPYGIAIADESGCLADRNTIIGNTVTNTRYGFSFYAYSSCSGLKNTVIEGNSFIDSREAGIRITSGQHQNVKIENNLISSSGGSPYMVPANINMANNIIASVTPQVVTATQTHTVVPQSPTYTPTPTKTASPTATKTNTPTPTFTVPPIIIRVNGTPIICPCNIIIP